MRKRDELSDPNSCLNKAKEDEMLFVLIDRDDAFPGTVIDWMRRRIRLGKNKQDDAKMNEALECAKTVLGQMNTRRIALAERHSAGLLQPEEQAAFCTLQEAYFEALRAVQNYQGI